MGKLPNKIIVGVVDRDDTYTGKLGFVSYPKSSKEPEKPHHSGVLGWVQRNKSKHPLMYLENEPTTGFVINKKVGGKKPYYSEYKGRTVKARVYDPRGFEFEIDMENMCHILENNGSFPGKSLDGEFVYAWMGSGSVFLLSCNSKEYKDLAKGALPCQHPLLKMSELEQFNTYKRVGGGDAIYLGDMDEVSVYNNSLSGFTSKKHPFFDLTNQQIQYPKDIIGISDTQIDFKTVKHRYPHSKHYLAKRRTIKLMSQEIYLKVFEYEKKHHSKTYVLYSDDPNVVNILPSRGFILMDGRLFNVSNYSDNIESRNYNEISFKNDVDNLIGVKTNIFLYVSTYSNDFTIDKENFVIPTKLNRYSFNPSKFKEEFDGKNVKIYTAKLDNLIEY